MKRSFRFVLFTTLPVSAMLAYAQAPHGVSQSSFAKCLPPDIQLSDPVDSAIAGSAKVTVEQRLNELSATCNHDNKLADGSGREIVFYHLTGCWGNPPENYQDILQKQRD